MTRTEDPPPISEQSPMYARVAIASVVLLLLIVHSPAIFHGFVNWDDQGQLFQNPAFNPPTFKSVARFWYTPHMNLYMPLTYTVWGVLAAIARRDAIGMMGESLDARWFHALSVFLHVCTTLGVFALLRRLIPSRVDAATCGALLFGLHPLQIEPVAWASAMYTLLCGAWSVAALSCYVVFAQRDSSKDNDPRRWHWLAAASLCYVLALLSKPSAVSLPLMAATIDWLLVRGPRRRAFVTLIVGLALAAPIAWLTNHFQPASNVQPQPWWFRPIVAGDAIAFQIVKVLAPFNLVADYGRAPTWLMRHPLQWTMALIPLMLAGLAWALRRRFPWLLAGLLLLIEGMAIYLGFIKFDFQYYSTVADRYVYLSMIGPAMIVAALVAAAERRNTARMVAVCVLGFFAIRSIQQVRVWRDTFTLFRHTLAINPDSLVANSVLAFVHAGRGEVPQAIDYYEAALRAYPDDPTANFNYANLLLGIGRHDRAVEHYRRALPGARPSELARFHNNLGVALASLGRFDEAAAEFQNALAADPHFADARSNLDRLPASTAPATP